ncbi:MAG TPA: DUF6600 domain-containing protein [Anaeromyxobacter sp.]|nr:DUF6600 domain-containing protein [Anaeromyxobacter sp.]
MLRRIALLFALTAVVAPAAGSAHEWEEDYTDEYSYAEPPDADVDVDIDASVTFDTFHGALAPYGQWVVVGSYGRVWRPHVATGWRPYYYGRWEWTNEGWLWVSEEPWGWAAYHYGRWTMDPSYGWIWVPGYQWAPAWVSWRYSGDVVGWAPLGPGVSVYVSVTSYHDHWWTFVPCRSFVAHPVHRVAYRPSYTRRYWHATSPAPAYRGRPGGDHAPRPAWGGPPPRTIEQRVGRPVTPVRVVAAPSPGAARVGNGEVAVYRPGLRGWNGRRPEARSGPRDDGRPAHRGDRDFVGDVRAERDRDRRDRALHGGTPARRQGGDFMDNVRSQRERDAARSWSQPDRGSARAPGAAPAPTARQDAPRFVPRGNGSDDGAPRFVPRGNGSHDAGPRFVPRGNGSHDAGPRVMAPSRGGGDRGERRGHH